jgi:hypothetical protein
VVRSQLVAASTSIPVPVMEVVVVVVDDLRDGGRRTRIPMGPMVMVMVLGRRKVDKVAMMMARPAMGIRSGHSLEPDQSDRHCAEDCRQFRDTTHC